MERNKSLLIAASYFWSDTLNAFVFGHGPASPTLADVLMLTGLEIATATTRDAWLFDVFSMTMDRYVTILSFF